MITLLVDEKQNTDGGITGITTTLSKFMYNLEIMGEEYKQNFLENVRKYPKGYNDMALIGRFIFLAQLGENNTNAQMIFWDTENDEEKALIVATTLMFISERTTENYRNAFMMCFETLRPQYQERYSDYELLVDLSHAN